jgi:hypothetical protein
MLVFLACRREKSECPSSPASQVDGRDKFVGQYRVNDTTGTYLYSMEIMKASGTSGIDSLFVFNWGNRFDMYVQHDKGNMTNLLNIVPPFPSFDHNGNRWAFFSQNDPVFQANMLIGDTLRMSYRISNIAFYNQDGVPYFDWSLV